MALMSGSADGPCCSKSSVVSPGSGRDFGAGIGRGMGPTFSPAWVSTQHAVLRSEQEKLRLTCMVWVMLIVGLPPFFLTNSSESHNVRPHRYITSTPASFADRITCASRSRAYASVSLSNTRWEILHDLNSFGSSVWGASRMRNSFEFLLSFVMDSERSFWQSSLRSWYQRWQWR